MVVTLDLAFLSLVDILLVVGDDSLGEGLPDGVDLGHVASSPHANADVEVLEAFKAEQQDGFKNFGAERLRLKEFDWGAVHSQHSLSRAHCGHCD